MYLDALPQDASFLGAAEHWTALRSPVFLKLRLCTVATQHAHRAQGVLMQEPAALPIVLPRQPVDSLVVLVVTAPWGAVGDEASPRAESLVLQVQ